VSNVTIHAVVGLVILNSILTEFHEITKSMFEI
jgi:hypothetical protein